MNHRATPWFWACYRRLPAEVQQLADRCYELLAHEPRHPSLHFKKVGKILVACVGLHYCAVGIEEGGDMIWVWIGAHAEYDMLLRG